MKIIVALSAFLFASALSSAATITFGEVNLSNGTQITNQYSGFGITVQNDYFYIDIRDTFDQKGISILQTPAIVTFTGTEKLVVEITVTVRWPLIVGLEVITPLIRMMSPVVRPCGTGVVTTLGFASVLLVIGMTVWVASSV